MASAARVAGTNNWDQYAKGTPEDLSAEQEEVLADFLSKVPREQLESMKFPTEPDRFFGCRVLRARKYDSAGALKLVAATSEWRSTTDVTSLAARTPHEIMGCMEDELFGFYPKAYLPLPDRDGRPIYIERTGIIDVDSMVLLTDLDRLVNYHIWCMERHMRERFVANSQSSGRPITSLITIMDMQGMTMKQLNATARAYISRAAALDSAHYPETLYKLLIINAPTIFQFAWAVVKGYLDERTTRKIEILGGEASWRPRMAELIGDDRTPTEYGGSLKVPGGLFPKSRMFVSTVVAGACCRQRVTVEAGDRIRFKWVSRGGDVKFGVSFYAQAAGAHASHQGSVDAATGKDEAPAPGATGPRQTPVVLGKVAGSETQFVYSELASPGPGTYVATWDNLGGWYQRTVLHRWDLMRDGHPVVLSADETGEGSNDPTARLARERAAAAATEDEGGGKAASGGAAATS